MESDFRRWLRVVDILYEAEAKIMLYHGTTPARARRIVADGLQPKGRKNTFGKSTSFSDKPVGVRFYDKGAVLVFKFAPHAKVINLTDYQKNGRGDADAVIGSADGHYRDREVAVFNPSSVVFVGWYNKMTNTIDAKEPVYPKDFYHNWND